MCRYVLLLLCNSRSDFQSFGFNERSMFEIQTKGIQTNNQEMNTIQLDQLPYLCLKQIFGFLDPPGLVRCRKVNRQFKFIADEIGAYTLLSNSWILYSRIKSEMQKLELEKIDSLRTYGCGAGINLKKSSRISTRIATYKLLLMNIKRFEFNNPLFDLLF